MLFVADLNSSSFLSARPPDIILRAFSTPSFIESALPAAYMARAEFKRTVSSFAPVSFPLKISSVIFAFSSGVPPFISSKGYVLSPTSSGEISNDLNMPLFISQRVVFPHTVASSRPSP